MSAVEQTLITDTMEQLISSGRRAPETDRLQLRALREVIGGEWNVGLCQKMSEILMQKETDVGKNAKVLLNGSNNDMETTRTTNKCENGWVVIRVVGTE